MPLPTWGEVWFWVFTVICAGGGAYFGSYLKKKGENLATHEDLKKLVVQMEATTRATKQIEATISNELWGKQKQWEMKKEAVYDVMRALGKTDETLHFASVTEVEMRQPGNEIKFKESNVDAWNAFYTAIDDFDQKRALSLIVCEKNFNDTLMRVKNHLRKLAYQLGQHEIPSYEEYGQASKLKEDFALAIAHARVELGIHRPKRKTGDSTPHSPESSAALTP